MATKTISVSMEAYERLVAARSNEGESFSRVICRAVWPPREGTAGDLLQRAQARDIDVDVGLLDHAQETDAPAADPWNCE